MHASGRHALPYACAEGGCDFLLRHQQLALSGDAVGGLFVNGEVESDDEKVEQLRLGTLTGFQYFSCYLRGREELLITINREAPAQAGSPGR